VVIRALPDYDAVFGECYRAPAGRELLAKYRDK
jgi:hypothetical protein